MTVFITVYFLFAVTKCREDLSLTKNRLTNADNIVDFSETAVNSCDDDEPFDDGTNRENIKCTTARARVGIWSHEEYSCHGTAPDLILSHTYAFCVILVIITLFHAQIHGLLKSRAVTYRPIRYV